MRLHRWQLESPVELNLVFPTPLVHQKVSSVPLPAMLFLDTPILSTLLRGLTATCTKGPGRIFLKVNQPGCQTGTASLLPSRKRNYYCMLRDPMERSTTAMYQL